MIYIILVCFLYILFGVYYYFAFYIKKELRKNRYAQNAISLCFVPIVIYWPIDVVWIFYSFITMKYIYPIVCKVRASIYGI